MDIIKFDRAEIFPLTFLVSVHYFLLFLILFTTNENLIQGKLFIFYF